MKDWTDRPPNAAQIDEALRSVLASGAFADVHRLRSFLEYIVAVTLKTPEARIRAKVIAADVYGRQSEADGDQEAIVRVDAGRLRRRLDLYYATEGFDDPLVISIPKGGYTPAFEVRAPKASTPVLPIESVGPTEKPAYRSLGFAALIAFVGFVCGWGINATVTETTQTSNTAQVTPAFDEDAEIRLSINQVSSASLLARTFVEEARHLTFPTIDTARPQAAEILCRRAIELAPDLALGHSCDAFVQAFFAFLAPPGVDRQTRLFNARTEAEKALSIDPADPFSQMASAWTLFVEGRRDDALEQATIAIKLGADEPFLRNFYGMMMAFDGRSSELLASGLAGGPDDDPVALYHPFIIAGAKLMTEDYAGVITAIEEAIALEGRTSSLITSIHISALENLGDTVEAEKLARNMYDTWKIDDVRPRLTRFFSEPGDVDAVAQPVDAVFTRLALHSGPVE